MQGDRPEAGAELAKACSYRELWGSMASHRELSGAGALCELILDRAHDKS